MESATKAMVSDPSRSRCVERRRPLGFRTGSSPCRWGIKAPTLTAEDPGPESDEAGKRGLPKTGTVDELIERLVQNDTTDDSK